MSKWSAEEIGVMDQLCGGDSARGMAQLVDKSSGRLWRVLILIGASISVVILLSISAGLSPRVANTITREKGREAVSGRHGGGMGGGVRYVGRLSDSDS
eukprot:2252572-Rhodomonas_salina.2